MNARRHGLATRLSDIPEQAGRLDRLSAILAEGSSHFLAAEESSIIAEFHLDLQRIRVVRLGVFHRAIKAQTMDDLISLESEIAKVNRYARRAVSRRKMALKELFPDLD
jgi:hypothetical protein